jgi:hypothetical protein
MIKAKVLTNFSSNKYTDSSLSTKGDSIVNTMLGNPLYQSLEEDVTSVKATLDYYKTLVAKSEDGGKSVIAQKNIARNDLESNLSTLGLKVQDFSRGDEIVIVNSGFDLKQKSVPVGELDPPVNVIAEPGTRTGTIYVSWNVVPGAKWYEVQYTNYPETATSVWQWLTCSKHFVTLEGIPEFQKMSIKVAGAGSDPRRDWSEVIVGYAK